MVAVSNGIAPIRVCESGGERAGHCEYQLNKRGAPREPVGVFMLERRTHPRWLTLKTGKIFGADDARDIECAILDMSEGGARILVSDPNEVPQKFLLKFDRTHTVYVCERIWTDGNRIGLSYHSAAASTVQGEP